MQQFGYIVSDILCGRIVSESNLLNGIAPPLLVWIVSPYHQQIQCFLKLFIVMHTIIS